MLCDICGCKGGVEMIDAVYRCKKCGSKALHDPHWKDYIEEVTSLAKQDQYEEETTDYYGGIKI